MGADSDDDDDAVRDEVEMALQVFGETCERFDGMRADALVYDTARTTGQIPTDVHTSNMEKSSSSPSNKSRVTNAQEEAVLVHLPLSLDLLITLPRHGYPDTKRPELSVMAGCNTQIVSNFSAELRRRAQDELALGGPMLIQLIVLAQQLGEEMEIARNDEAARRKLSTRKSSHTNSANNTDGHDTSNRRVHAGIAHTTESGHGNGGSSGITIWSGPAITDRKSKFVAHMARVSSVTDVKAVLSELRSDKSIACAAHPTIWAYRFTHSDGVLHQDCDDDGEHGASARILFLLDQLNVNGFVIVVTRWFGGILLGTDRFKHIMEAAKNMLLTIPDRATGV